MSDSEYHERRENTLSTALATLKDRIKMDAEMWAALSAEIRTAFTSGIDQHLKPLLEGLSSSSSSNATNFGSDLGTSGGKRKNGRQIAWNEWKADPNNDEKSKYKDDNGVEISAYKWWGDAKWNKMTDDEKKPYNDQAKKHNDQVKSSGGGATNSAKKGASGATKKSAFILFQEANKMFYKKEDRFNDPKTNAPCTGYEISRKIWSESIKDDPEMSSEFTKMSEGIKNGTIDYDAKNLKLPHLDWNLIKSDKFKSYDDAKKLID
jgi:hypothetical protein